MKMIKWITNSGLLLQVREIFNFSQDDLMTEDIFILDCHSCIFVWVGRHVDTKLRAQALSIGEVLIILIFLDCHIQVVKWSAVNLHWVIRLLFFPPEIYRTWHPHGESISTNTTLCDHWRKRTSIFHKVLHLGLCKISSKHFHSILQCFWSCVGITY